MERTYRASELVTVPQIADRAKVDYRTVHQWRSRFPDFPAPVAGTVYCWPDVEEWLKETGRL